ncbi:MAG: hypothetical protein Q9162_001534 [Coniocarpon cinnabarinum]
MASKTPSNAPRGRKRANEPHLEDPGNVGRATGLHMPRVSKGGDEQFDNLSEYFPTTGKANRGQRSGLEVTEHLQQRSAKSTQKPPPPTRSPIRAPMRGTPRRPSSAGPTSSARTQATAARTSNGTPGSIPRLDFHPGQSPRRPYTPRLNGDARRSGTFSISPSPEKGRRASEPARDQETDLDDTTANMDEFDDQANVAPEANMDNDTLGDMQPNTNFDDSLASSEGSARKTRGKGRPQTSARRTRQSDQSLDLQTNGVVEDEAPVDAEESILPEQDESEQVEPGNDQMDDSLHAAAPQRKKPGRPPKAEAANSKKVRKNAAKESTQPKQPPSEKRALANKDTNKKIVVANETRSNTRERHETPYDEDETRYHNRFGRLVYKPLAHWKNEHVNVKPLELDSGRFVYETTDVVRMDDITPQKRIINRSGDNTTRKRRKRKAATVFEDSDPDDGAEPWETAEGVISGAVRMWDTELENGVDEKRHQELAFAASKIEARDNAEGSFRFAKTLTMPFFGSGIVELPPGGIKRTKNSRRMQMMFFVHFGKVTVDVQGTKFTISKGGVWQIPRAASLAVPGAQGGETRRFGFALDDEAAETIATPQQRHPGCASTDYLQRATKPSSRKHHLPAKRWYSTSHESTNRRIRPESSSSPPFTTTTHVLIPHEPLHLGQTRHSIVPLRLAPASIRAQQRQNTVVRTFISVGFSVAPKARLPDSRRSTSPRSHEPCLFRAMQRARATLHMLRRAAPEPRSRSPRPFAWSDAGFSLPWSGWIASFTSSATTRWLPGSSSRASHVRHALRQTDAGNSDVVPSVVRELLYCGEPTRWMRFIGIASLCVHRVRVSRAFTRGASAAPRPTFWTAHARWRLDDLIGCYFPSILRNNYSISNDTEHDAKLFFAQGCEVDLNANNVPTSQDVPTAE